MKPFEKIVQERGQAFLDAILLINTNFYMSELEIIDLCARWIPRRKILREKFYLVSHASDEVRHAGLFKKEIEDLGIPWSDELITRYRLSDIGSRFDRLHKSDDEIEVLIGLNLYAEGVIAMEELVELSQYASEYFPTYAQIQREEQTHLAFGQKVLQRLLSESEEDRARAQVICDGYRDHLLHYLWNDISPIIDMGIGWNCLSEKYRENTVNRFESVMTTAGLDVEWPTGRVGVTVQ